MSAHRTDRGRAGAEAERPTAGHLAAIPATHDPRSREAFNAYLKGMPPQTAAEPRLEPGLHAAVARAGRTALESTARGRRAPMDRMAVAGVRRSNKRDNADGYENDFVHAFEGAGGKVRSPSAVAQGIVKRHKAQKTIILNEINVHDAVLDNARGAAYRDWVVQVARAVTQQGKSLVVCTPMSGDRSLEGLWKALSRISGVRLGTETQITSDDSTESVRDRLEESVAQMRALGIPPSRLVHIANLATTSEAYDFGSSGTSRHDMARFRANVKAQVHAANALGYGGALGYGFREPARDKDGQRNVQPETAARISVIRAWNAAWRRVEHRDAKTRQGEGQRNS